MSEEDILPNLNASLAYQLISEQFPEYAHLQVRDVEKQGHDNRTYRLGDNMLIRMPTYHTYALKVPKEYELLPKLAQHLSIDIPVPIKIGVPCKKYPYPFSIYKWLPGTSINLLNLNLAEIEQLSYSLPKFLKELQAIESVEGPTPGQHNWWRGDNISVYDKGARKQIASLSNIINSYKALNLWEQACATKWHKQPVWIHGDLATGNIIMQNGKLSAIIDFGGTAIGDPACDLVITWTYLTGKAREIFVNEMNLGADVWLRARAWALWKATYELCNIQDKDNPQSLHQRRIIDEIIENI